MDILGQLWERVSKEWHVIVQAKGLFACAVVLLVVVVWQAMEWRHGGIEATQQATESTQRATIENQREQIANLKQKLDESFARIQDVTQRLSAVPAPSGTQLPTPFFPGVGIPVTPLVPSVVATPDPTPAPSEEKKSAPSRTDTPLVAIPPKTISKERLHEMTNDEIRAEAYQMASQIDRFFSAYNSRKNIIDYDESLDEPSRARRLIALDYEMNREFKDKLRDPALNITDELLERLHMRLSEYGKSFVDELHKPGIVPLGDVIELSNYLSSNAKELP
jgi:hypothetical protein